jgi:hypothetical protein
MPKLVPPALLALVLPAAACDAQVDSDHRGTPLARLTGTVRNTRTLGTGDAEVVVGLLGMDTEHLLVYAPAGIPEGSYASYMLRSTPPPGFHLYGVRRPTEEEAAARQVCIDALGPDPEFPAIYTQCGGFPYFDDFVPLPDDLQTPLEIELVDDPSTIEPPNWM